MKRIVIVGGSYGGLRALQALASHPDLHITLVDRHPYHFLQTEGYDLIAGKVPFDETIVGLRSLCAGLGEKMTYLHAVAESVDTEKNQLLCEGGERLPYDYLIVAAGAVTRFLPTVEGLRSCSYGVKSLTGAFRLKQFFEAELYRRLESAANAKAHYSILVVGGGLSGVEIAAEMQAYFNRYYRSNALACGKLKIHLVSGSLLRGLPDGVVARSRKRLQQLGVLLHVGTHLSRVESDRALLDDGREIPFDFMIYAGGIMAAPFVQSLPFEKNRLGQIEVDEYLRARGSKNVYVVGDAADLRDRRGRVVPPTAQSAEQSGTQAAQNILRHMAGVPQQKADIRLRGLAIALGGYDAIIDAGAFRLYGPLAWLGKKAIEKSYKWPLKRIARKGFKKLKTCRQM